MTTAWLALLAPLALPDGLLLESLGARRLEVPLEASALICGASDGSAWALPSSEVRVRARIDGFVARTVVRQTFHNPSSAWIEARYVHPLPEAGAVEGFAIRVGDRWIRGEVQPEADARRTFERARRRGHSAALVGQLRSNLFDTRVANIPPGAAVQVRFVVREVLNFREGAFTYRFPIPVTPRFHPGPELAEALGARGEVQPRIDVRVCARPGIEARTVSRGAERHVASDQTCFRTSDAGRDFVVRWTPDPDAETRAGAFTERFEGEVYAALMMVPPQPERVRALPREIIFVLDTSGSMGGPSMPQARDAVIEAIERLSARDCFDVVAFDDDVRTFWGECRVATSEHRQTATRFVRGLRADGGTRMGPALATALERPGRETLRQVVFVTDGAVGHEPELLRRIEARRTEARLFTVGIGSAPNAAFMRDAARVGRGTFTFIGSTLEVEAQMSRLFAELSHPTIRDVAIDWGTEADVVHARSELYAGQPVMVLAKLATEPPGPIRVRGRTVDAPWMREIRARDGAKGLHALWARGRVTELEDAHRLGDGEASKHAVTELGLKHRLLTRFTRFVAVDRGTRRPGDAPVESHRVATPTPDGAAKLPQGGTPSAGLLSMASLLAVGALAWCGRRS